MDGCTMRPIVCSAISLFALTGVACFPGATGAAADATPPGARFRGRAIPVVPATEAPPPPEGTGWSCYEAAKPNRFAPSVITHETRCMRSADSCTRASDTSRNTPGATVSFCQPREKAFCTAFVSGPRVTWSCFANDDECAAHVGLPGYAPEGTTQTQCAEYP